MGIGPAEILDGALHVTDFDWSNIANEWCASAELAVSIAAMAMRLEFSTLFICSSTDPEFHFFLSKKARR